MRLAREPSRLGLDAQPHDIRTRDVEAVAVSRPGWTVADYSAAHLSRFPDVSLARRQGVTRASKSWLLATITANQNRFRDWRSEMNAASCQQAFEIDHDSVISGAPALKTVRAVSGSSPDRHHIVSRRAAGKTMANVRSC